MSDHGIIGSIVLIFSGAALLATLALFARQSVLVAYTVLGVLVGPWGLDWAGDVTLIQSISQVGIIFLLFLLGMNLEPAELLRSFRETAVVTLTSSLVFLTAGAVIATAFGFGLAESLLIGAASMFSSTLLGLKLLPTTTLHQQHMGRLMVGILLLQDILAIFVLLGVQAGGEDGWRDWIKPLVGLPLLWFGSLACARWGLSRLLARFDRIGEYVFLLAVGWCLGMAEAGARLGLGHEIGAFVGGVSLAVTPVARYIAEHLKPLRDFFLVMFFFSLGAALDLGALLRLWAPLVALTGAMLLLKPPVFAHLLRSQGEKPAFARQLGVRLGQISEFSLLIAVLAAGHDRLGHDAAVLVQAATLLSLVISGYWIVARYPTPIAVDEALRRD